MAFPGPCRGLVATQSGGDVDLSRGFRTSCEVRGAGQHFQGRQRQRPAELGRSGMLGDLRLRSPESGGHGPVLIGSGANALLFVGGQVAGSAAMSPRLRSYIVSVRRSRSQCGAAQSGLPRFRVMEATAPHRPRLLSLGR